MNTKKTGWRLIYRPLLLILIVFILYILSGFLSANTDTETNLITIFNYILSVVGMLSGMAFVIGLPIGIYFIKRKINTDELKSQQDYKHLTTDEIYYIADWSWSAFFISPIWALGNKLYLYILGLFIPIFNIYIWLKLSAHGRKIAWEKNQWRDFQLFKKRQKIIMWTSVVLVILSCFLLILQNINKEAQHYNSIYESNNDNFREISN